MMQLCEYFELCNYKKGFKKKKFKTLLLIIDLNNNQ